jgi:hypothetical protein
MGDGIILDLQSRSGISFYFLLDAYPSAYHPPPLSSKVQALMIFFVSLLLH